MSETREIVFAVNGMRCQMQVEPRLLLVHCLRNELGLTGTHVGCETAQCGACTVLVDGEAVKSCNLLAVQADGANIVTIEGLAQDGQLHPIQQAFCENYAVQCGYCTPGMIMCACELLQKNRHPGEEEVRHALYGNLCRCTGYQNIVDAIRYAAELINGAGTAP